MAVLPLYGSDRERRDLHDGRGLGPRPVVSKEVLRGFHIPGRRGRRLGGRDVVCAATILVVLRFRQP
ncbi:MAG: hypothetical protein ACRDNG_08845 [Gaiellaceae bacterium]